MPAIVDNITINNKSLDRRIKLTDDDKELIKWLREEEELSYQKLANKFGVSKRLIIFVCKPETLEACKQKRKERGGSKIYYDKDYNTEKMREHRHYKSELLIKGLIKNNNHGK